MVRKSGMVMALCFWSIFGMLGWQASARAQEAPARWTVMVYMAGDNSLEMYVPIDIETEFAKVGSSQEVEVLVLADRAPLGSMTAGNWKDTRLFHVTKGMEATAENAVEAWGERNMGDPQTLIDFLNWGRAHYPAERTLLVFWDHGWGWRPNQSILDATSRDALDMHEIVAALQATYPVDVVGYDACLMQTIEVQATWRPLAHAIVASEDTVGGEGFRYEQILKGLQADPDMSDESLAILMGETMQDRTVSSVVLNEDWDTLLAAVDEWSLALLDGLNDYRAEYDEVYAQVQDFDDPLFKDLYGAAEALEALVPDARIQAASQAVMDAMDVAVLYEWHRGYAPGSNGITIFWPQRPADLDEASSPDINDFDYYRTVMAFSRLTHWDEFLDAYVVRSSSRPASRRP